MTNKRHEGNLNAIVSGLKVNNGLPTVEIKNFAVAGDGMARVTVEVTHNQASRADHALVARSLEQKLQGRMTAVAGSFSVLEKGQFADRLSGIVAVTRQAIAATEANLKGFRATASNMFMDDESDMWVLRKTEAGGLLVKTTGIDDDMTLLSLLESNSSAGFRNSHEFGRVTASSNEMAASVEGGQFVSYVNINNQVVHGFVVASDAASDKIVTLPVGSQEEEVVSRLAVTQVHDQADFPKVEPTKEEQVAEVVASARGEIDLPFLLDYYKKIYQRSPQFFAMFADRLKNHQFY